MKSFKLIFREPVEVRGQPVNPGEEFEEVCDPGIVLYDDRCAYAEGVDDKNQRKVFLDTRTAAEKNGIYDYNVQRDARSKRRRESLLLSQAQEAALKNATLEAIKTGKMSVDADVVALAEAQKAVAPKPKGKGKTGASAKSV